MNEPTYKLEKIIKTKTDMYEDFVGPLDLILLLLSKNKVEIKDIQISLILEQYLAYLEKMKEMNLEIASEFITMASHLMYLKSRMLVNSADEEVLTEIELLIKNLEERQSKENYAKIKEVLDLLAPMANFGENIFLKQPEPLQQKKEYNYFHDSADLLSAMEEILRRRVNGMPPPLDAFEEIIVRAKYRVRDKADEVMRRLIRDGDVDFTELFDSVHDRGEAVAVFMAVLELCRAGNIFVKDEDGQLTVMYISNKEVDFDD